MKKFKISLILITVLFFIVMNSGCTSEPENKTYKSQYMEFQYPSNLEMEVGASNQTVYLKSASLGLSVKYYDNEKDYLQVKNAIEEDCNFYSGSKELKEVNGTECEVYTWQASYYYRAYCFEKNGKYFIAEGDLIDELDALIPTIK
ncbi:MAG: hypothetical protein CIT01_03375 [Methanobacterium sp. BRmetb2]|nr:MAG: hypothetical protein CIT01_03375 [Methanobacterium sp. BRmetb2]